MAKAGTGTKHYRVTLCWYGETFTYYTHARSPYQAKMFSYRAFDRYKRMEGSQAYFQCNGEKVSVQEIYVTKHNQIKEVL